MKTTPFGSLHPLYSLEAAQDDPVHMVPVILRVAPEDQGRYIEPEIVNAAVVRNIALGERVLFPVRERS